MDKKPWFKTNELHSVHFTFINHCQCEFIDFFKRNISKLKIRTDIGIFLKTKFAECFRFRYIALVGITGAKNVHARKFISVEPIHHSFNVYVLFQLSMEKYKVPISQTLRYLDRWRERGELFSLILSEINHIRYDQVKWKMF